jgi:hypothetical protein
MSRHKSGEGGYASVAAIVLCAALSLVCAGILAMVQVQKKQAERSLFRTQQAEAVNTALLRFGQQVARAQGDGTLVRDELVEVPGGRATIALRAEYEGRKWPLARAEEVDETVLGQYLKLEKAAVIARLPTALDAPPKDDCLRSLFSTFGFADPKHAFPAGKGLIGMSGGHDGQMWRLRAITGNRGEERIVRFLGDPNHLFAVVSQEEFSLGEMPTCTQLTNQP